MRNGGREQTNHVVGRKRRPPFPMEQTQAQTQALSDKQREAFARLLADAKKQAQARLEDDDDLKSRIEKDVAAQLVKDRSAVGLVKKIRSLKKKLEASEEALSKLGFTCDEDSIDTVYEPPKPVVKAIEAAVKAARDKRDAELQKFDRATLRVWTPE